MTVGEKIRQDVDNRDHQANIFSSCFYLHEWLTLDLAENINLLMLQQKLSRDQLITRLKKRFGLSKRHLMKVFEGSVRITLMELICIAQALGHTMEVYFVSEEEIREQESQQEEQPST